VTLVTRAKDEFSALAQEVQRACEGFSEKVGFALVFGSAATGHAKADSDIDVALYYLGDRTDAFEFLKVVSGRLSSRYDVKILQLLPLFVQVEAVRGHLLFGNEALLYEVATAVVREYDSFRPRYLDYIRPYSEASE
jgi:predicted nucleotidyltransferase